MNLKSWILAFVTLLHLGIGSSYAGAQQAYLVEEIFDGKTIQVSSEIEKYEVSLAGIDSVSPKAKAYLEKNLFNKNIYLIENDKHDYYVIREQDEVFINEELLRNGLASYKKGFESKYDTSLFRAQSMAQEAELGIWEKGAFKPKRQYKKKSSSRAPPKKDIVYITRTGKKYHRASCRYLRQSKIPIERKKAVKMYGACKVCRP